MKKWSEIKSLKMTPEQLKRNQEWVKKELSKLTKKKS